MHNFTEMKSFSSFSNIPNLKLRKDIWSHFPVCLIKHLDTDGRDRYSIQWHRQKLQEWSQGIPMYESVAKVRLLQALRDCNKWSVEPSNQHHVICVIAMNFSNETKVHSVLPAIFAPSPPIHCIEDLKDFFPVCWKQTKNGLSLEFHNTLVRALSERFKMPEPQLRDMVQEKLMNECQTLWIVHPSSRPSQICKLIPKQV